MKRRIPGLHAVQPLHESPLAGAFLVRVARFAYRWHSRKPFFLIQFAILEPKEHEARIFSGRLYCTPKALWKLNWFLRDFAYDSDLLGRDEIDEKAVVNLRGIVRTYSVSVNGHCFQNLEAFAPAEEWETLYSEQADQGNGNDLQLHPDQ